MKNSILIITVIFFFASACKKENQVQPELIRPVKIDTFADVELLTTSLIPSTVLPTDSVNTLTFKIRIAITARDSDLFLPRSIPSEYKLVLDLRLRGNTSWYNVSLNFQPEHNVVIQSTGNLKISAWQRAIVSYTAQVKTPVHRGEYRLELYNVVYSVGQDDNDFESKTRVGPEYVTEYLPA